MGDNRRIVDSEGEEATVTAALSALKVEIIDSAGVTIEDLEAKLDGIETLLEGTALVKIWDGTNTLAIDEEGMAKVHVYGFDGGEMVSLDLVHENDNWNAGRHGLITMCVDKDSTPDKYRTLQVDVDGIIKMPAITGEVEVVQPTSSDLKTAIFGLEGTTQRQIAVNSSGQVVIDWV